jgi:aldose 1-epimerase
MRKAAVLVCEETGIAMDTYTDKPGVQLYTCNAMDEGMPGKDGAVYGVHKALCLETQLFPNAVKHSHFPSAVLKAGDAQSGVLSEGSGVFHRGNASLQCFRLGA